MSLEIDTDFTAEFAAENAAIERIVNELVENHVPSDEVRDVREKLQQPGTVVINAPAYKIRRDADEVFHLDWKNAA